MVSMDFIGGMFSAIEKRAQTGIGFLDVLNAAANIQTLGDVTNRTLRTEMNSNSSDDKNEKPKAEPEETRYSADIDKDLVARLTPEQRRRIISAVSRLKD